MSAGDTKTKDLTGYKYFFFDLDGTLTPSRTVMHEHVHALLEMFLHPIIVVTGSKVDQIDKQIRYLSTYKLAQNGNHAVSPTKSELWKHTLTEPERNEIHSHIAKIYKRITHHIPDENDLIEDRGSQISFSIYGHNACPQEKKACDGDFKIRKQLLKENPFVSDSLDVQLGGSTSFDYFKRGCNKGYNISTLIEKMNWDSEECIYFGDALFPSGNDSSVLGVIDTIAVKDEQETYLYLRNLLNRRA